MKQKYQIIEMKTLTKLYVIRLLHSPIGDSVHFSLSLSYLFHNFTLDFNFTSLFCRNYIFVTREYIFGFHGTELYFLSISISNFRSPFAISNWISVHFSINFRFFTILQRISQNVLFWYLAENWFKDHTLSFVYALIHQKIDRMRCDMFVMERLLKMI